MVTLIRALVTEKGSTFAVDIDATECVCDLKDTIAVKRKYDFAAGNLQLFLVKTSNDTWLD
jgi:shikimate kinase